jgi:hypothetical protein
MSQKMACFWRGGALLYIRKTSQFYFMKIYKKNITIF